MSDDSKTPSLMDLMVAALSPILIIGLVGSVGFFLLDVFYGGQFIDRLNYLLAWFVIAIVLIARVSISVDKARATLYGLALAVVTLLAMQMYVRYPANSGLAGLSLLINPLVMAMVWWLAHKITWDCTHIDERREASGKGLLAAVGLDQDNVKARAKARAKAQGEALQVNDKPVNQEREARRGLLERYERYRKREKKKPHTPGLWILYFAAIALPAFALGQALVPTEELERRRYLFRLMLLFTGSSLGLLMTTSFLGIRHYLRQRHLPMPTKMASLWLALGAGLVLVFLIIGALLPRPHSEYPLISQRLGSEERQASKNAVLRDGSAGKGEGRGGSQTKPGDGEQTASKGGKAGQGQGEGKRGSGSQKGKQGGGGNQRRGESNQSGSQRGEGKEGDNRRSNQQRRDEQNQNGRQAAGNDRRDQASERPSGSNGDRQEQSSDGGQQDGSSSSAPPDLGPLTPVVETIAKLLKWAIFALIVLLVLFLIFYRGLSWLANFMPWARRWLEGLQAWWQGLFARAAGKAEEAEEELPYEPDPLPFSAFVNPFAVGYADRRSLSQLIRYSFAALEAWAREQGFPRLPQETPLEFATRLSEEFPALEEVIRRLGTLYVRLAYASGGLPKSTRTILEQFWQRLEAHRRTPLSV